MQYLINPQSLKCSEIICINVDALVNFLIKHNKISTLEFTHNTTGNGKRPGPDSIKKIFSIPFPNLTILNLEDNRIKEEGMKEIANVIANGKIGRLKYLNLKSSYLAGAIKYLSTPKILNNLSDLDYLNLGFNKITSEHISNFVNDLTKENLPKLTQLELGGNYIGDKGALTIASSLSSGKLKKLKFLNLKSTTIGVEGRAALMNACSQKRNIELLM